MSSFVFQVLFYIIILQWIDLKNIKVQTSKLDFMYWIFEQNQYCHWWHNNFNCKTHFIDEIIILQWFNFSEVIDCTNNWEYFKNRLPFSCWKFLNIINPFIYIFVIFFIKPKLTWKNNTKQPLSWLIVSTIHTILMIRKYSEKKLQSHDARSHVTNIMPSYF